MEYKYNYIEGNLCTISLINDQVKAKIYLNSSLYNLDIELVNLGKYNRKKISVSYYLNEIIKFLQENTYIIPINHEYRDLFDKDNVRRIRIVGLKVEDKDIKNLARFKKVYHLDTKNCTFYKDCNLGILKCDISDKNSDLYSLDSLNGFSGDYISFRKTHIVRMNKNLLHLNNQVLEFFGVDMDYEKFLLTTDAPNMRRLNIYRCPRLNRLKNKDLLFISGFYNLEGINIDGVVDNYDQFDKLERLRELKSVVLESIDNKYKNHNFYLEALKEGFSDVKLFNFLCRLRLYSQNKHYDLRHKLYVPRLERVKFEGCIKNQTVEEIQQKLIEFYQLDYQTRKDYLREPKKEMTLFDDIHNLFFDVITRKEDDEPYVVVNSRPFDLSGIDYYVENKKIKIIK